MRALSEQIQLAKAADFYLGGLSVRPSQCRIVSPAGEALLQPRIMQVLVVLAARRGDVVSRDELMAQCWGGFAVSDDAIHRCIARLRRLAETHGGFAIATVPRVGYQLSEILAPSPRGWHPGRGLKLAAGIVAAVLLFAAGLIGAHLF